MAYIVKLMRFSPLKNGSLVHHLSSGSNINVCSSSYPTILHHQHQMRRHGLLFQKYLFHTSPKRQIHPLIILLTKPIGKLVAIISGRYVRKSWKLMSPEQKAHFKSKVGNNKKYIFAALGLLFSAGVINFVTHIQETPVTKRKRFIAFTPEQFMKIAQYEYDMQLETYQDQILKTNHPAYDRVIRVGTKIVNANQDLEFFTKQKWTVVVINDPAAINAFVLPTGAIFVFTGILDVCSTDDLLAVVLGHEMSHALLSHGAEQVSVAAVIDWMIILVMAGIWAIMPSDGIALVTQWFYNKVVELLLHLPYSRKLEDEADEVGLQLAAKACFDVRNTSALWDMMGMIEKHGNYEDPLPEFLTTHPSHNNRSQRLETLIPKAIELRTSCNCPRLPASDPRIEVAKLREQLEEEKDAKSDQPSTHGTSNAPPAITKGALSSSLSASGKLSGNTNSVKQL